MLVIFLKKNWPSFSCGLHRTYIGSVERCERNVTLSTLEVFATVLNTTVPALLTSKGRTPKKRTANRKRGTHNVIPLEKIYSSDKSTYEQKTVSQRLEALFLANVGLVVTRDQILAAARDPVTKNEPENWHQRLSELRTDKGYTILSWRDWKALSPQEYVLASVERRQTAAKRVRPSKSCWAKVLIRAQHSCEWREDGQSCGLHEGAIDPIGGGTVK